MSVGPPGNRLSAGETVGGYLDRWSWKGRLDADIYEAHARELVRFAAGLVGPADAQDVVSEAALRVMSSRIWPKSNQSPGAALSGGSV
ncbi:MAG: hypothetical protein ACR2ME_00820 [Acidimicrobiia bacterium]